MPRHCLHLNNGLLYPPKLVYSKMEVFAVRSRQSEPELTIADSSENLSVYSALRDEIIQMEESQMNYTVYMYVVFFAAFGFAATHRYLFIVCLLVLLIFQSLINYRVWLRHKVSTYIRVFFELPRNDIHWESFNCNKKFMKIESKQHKQLSQWIAYHAAGFLAIVTTIIDVSLIIDDIVTYIQFQPPTSWYLIRSSGEGAIAIILCISVLVVTYQFDNKKDTELEDVIKKYKISIKKSHNLQE